LSSYYLPNAHESSIATISYTQMIHRLRRHMAPNLFSFESGGGGEKGGGKESRRNQDKLVEARLSRARQTCVVGAFPLVELANYNHDATTFPLNPPGQMIGAPLKGRRVMRQPFK
jgi:hypothetical protein